MPVTPAASYFFTFIYTRMIRTMRCHPLKRREHAPIPDCNQPPFIRRMTRPQIGRTFCVLFHVVTGKAFRRRGDNLSNRATREGFLRTIE